MLSPTLLWQNLHLLRRQMDLSRRPSHLRAGLHHLRCGQELRHADRRSSRRRRWRCSAVLRGHDDRGVLGAAEEASHLYRNVVEHVRHLFGHRAHSRRSADRSGELEMVLLDVRIVRSGRDSNLTSLL